MLLCDNLGVDSSSDTKIHTRNTHFGIADFWSSQIALIVQLCTSYYLLLSHNLQFSVKAVSDHNIFMTTDKLCIPF